MRAITNYNDLLPENAFNKNLALRRCVPLGDTCVCILRCKVFSVDNLLTTCAVIHSQTMADGANFTLRFKQLDASDLLGILITFTLVSLSATSNRN